MNGNKQRIVPRLFFHVKVPGWLAVIVMSQFSLSHCATAQIPTSLEGKKAVVDEKIMDYLAMITKIEQDYACWIDTETFTITDQEDGVRKDYWSQCYAANAKNSWKFWSRRLAYMGKPGPSSHWFQYLMSKDGRIKKMRGLHYPPIVEIVRPSGELKDGRSRYLPPTMWCVLESSDTEYAVATHGYILKLYVTDTVAAKNDGYLKLSELAAEESGDVLATWSASNTLVDGLHVDYTNFMRFDKDHGLPIARAFKVKYNDVERVVAFAETKWEQVGELFVPVSIYRVEENAKGDRHTETQQKLKWILGDEHPDSSPAEESDDWRTRYCRLFEVNCTGSR